MDAALTDATAYVRGTIKTIRDAEIAVTRRKAKGPTPAAKYDERKPKEVSIFVADAFPEWQNVCVTAVHNHYDPASGAVDDAKVRQELAEKGLLKDKKAMPFVMAFKVRGARRAPPLTAETHCRVRLRARVQPAAAVPRGRHAARGEQLPQEDAQLPHGAHRERERGPAARRRAAGQARLRPQRGRGRRARCTYVLAPTALPAHHHPASFAFYNVEAA